MSSLTISNNECLQYIYIQTYSLKEIRSLSISNLPELVMFVTEYDSFYETTRITLSSMF